MPVPEHEASSPAPTPDGARTSLTHALFFLSGVSALLYQVIWQRTLLELYGTNVESVALVVAAFMAGLGLGSLAGGWMSTLPRTSPVLLFGLCELGIGAFGFVSLDLFHRVGELTLRSPIAVMGILCFLLLLLPTLLMGATLPLLTTHTVRRSGNVGRSVSELYAVNTYGAAAGALLAALALGTLGQRHTLVITVALNVVAGVGALAFLERRAA